LQSSIAEMNLDVARRNLRQPLLTRPRERICISFCNRRLTQIILSLSPTSTSVTTPQGLAAKVLPLGTGVSSNSWTTVPNTGSEYHALAETDSTLRPTRILGGSLAAVGTAPDGKSAIEVFVRDGMFKAQGQYLFTDGRRVCLALIVWQRKLRVYIGRGWGH
jgi:hypothetical protein